MTYPTSRTVTLVDIALMGVCLDEYTEKFRGTSYHGTEDEAAYIAAYRIIRGRAKPGDEDLVRKIYETRIMEAAFTQKGQLSAFFKREVYMTREERYRIDQAAAERMKERQERRLYEELKKKYG